jgi:FlaA1/EpsC-like NDP-sugar epimerase
VEAYAPQFGYRPDQIAIETIGTRAGEKSHEVLMTADEAARAESSERMYVVPPSPVEAVRGTSSSHGAELPPVLDRTQVRDLLDAAGWLRPAILPSMG